MTKFTGWLVMTCLAFLTFCFTGCSAYNVPLYVDVNTSETAFVIPLEGETKNQAMFDSEQYLEQRKVALKRIQIPKRWNQEGRLWNDGSWIPLVRVVKVNRSPITRQWGGQHGQPAVKGASEDHGNSLWLQSSDNISFSIGFNCTAYIAETNAAKFLYWYRGDSLENVMDTEIKARYQQAAAKVSSGMKMDDLKSHTQDIVHEIEREVVPFFAERGISITTIGQFGGIEYRDRKIMDAIEDTYVAQQEKVKAAASLAAQGDLNKVIEMKATAEAEAAKTKAAGEAEGKYSIAQKDADGKLKLALAEAAGIREVAKAINEASSSDGVLKLRALEVERAKAEKWQGGVPQFLINGSGTGEHGGLPTIVLDGRTK